MPTAPPPAAAAVVERFTDSLADDKIAAVDLLDRTAAALLSAVPVDLWCAVLLDPSTLLDTGGVHTDGFPAHVMPRLFEIEHTEQIGIDSLRNLARRRNPVSVLSTSTRGQLETSVYYRDILAPIGLADEMRVLLRDGTRTWALLCLCRSATSGGSGGGFTDLDKTIATALTAPATSALRGALLRAGSDRGDLPDAPGMLIVTPDGELVSASPSAQRWLADLHEQHASTAAGAGATDGSGCGPARGGLPYAVRALVSRVRGTDQAHPAHARAMCRSGQWAGMHAWTTGPDGQIVIAIGPADLGELVAIVLDAYGLTPREREVTQQVLRGRSTTEIATTLQLSTHTVQDHLKAVFAKTGVGSRRELVATIFFQHYHPHLGHAPLTTDGRLRDDDHPT